MIRRTHHRALVQGIGGKIAGIVAMLTGIFLAASRCFGGPATPSPPNLFRPASTPADAIFRISIFVLIIAGVIFAVVFSVLVYFPREVPPECRRRWPRASTSLWQRACFPESLQQMRSSGQTRGLASKIAGIGVLLAGFLLGATLCFGGPADPSQSLNIFKPQSTPADSIFRLSMVVLTITGAIFAVVFSLLVYAISKYRRRGADDGSEPPQVYGSNQVELAWTVIPVLIVLVLFLVTARVIHSIQDAPQPPGAIEVVAIGHQFWWEFRYPGLGVVTANELHVPVSNPLHPTPTFMTLSSADTDHSFWVPRLAGKTDLIPNRVNHMWIDPHETGLYLGQCAQYCGTQHAKMLLRVYVDSPEQFEQWVQTEKKPALISGSAEQGRQVFETTACVNCHAISGTLANGRFGPDLTHLMSRETIASGAAPNTPEQLKLWIRNPGAIKPGSLMPAMQLSEKDLDALTAYLETLR